MDLAELTTAELAAESKRLTALKAWGPRLAAIDAELKRRCVVELAQDSYYYGTAADFSGVISVPLPQEAIDALNNGDQVEITTTITTGDDQ